MRKGYTFQGQSPEHRLPCIFQATGNILLQRCRASMTKPRPQSTRVRAKAIYPTWSQVCSVTELSYDPSIPLLGIYLKELKAESQEIFAYACSQKYYSQQPRGGGNPSVHPTINKQNVWNLHTMEYYSVLKRKETMIHATIWMTLEDVMLSEIIKSQKVKYCMIILT